MAPEHHVVCAVEADLDPHARARAEANRGLRADREWRWVEHHPERADPGTMNLAWPWELLRDPREEVVRAIEGYISAGSFDDERTAGIEDRAARRDPRSVNAVLRIGRAVIV